MMDAMWVQAVIVGTSRWRGSFISWPGKGGSTRGWCLGACREGAQTHRTGKKKRKAKKVKNGLTGTQASCVSCVCVASVRARREVHGGGVCGDGIGRVFVRALQWRGCFDFWAQGHTGMHAGCRGRRAEHMKLGGKKSHLFEHAQKSEMLVMLCVRRRFAGVA